MSNHPPPERLHSIPDVAALFGTDRSTVYRWINQGRLDTVRIGRTRRVTDAQLRHLIDTHTATAKETK